MEHIPAYESLRDGLAAAATRMASLGAAWLPRMLLAALLVIAGWILARAVQTAVGAVLRKTGVDHTDAWRRVAEALEPAGVTASVSSVASRASFWAVFGASLLGAAHSMGIRAVEKTLDAVFGFLPNLFGAVLIVAVAVPLVKVLRGVAVSAAAAAGLAEAVRLGAAAQLLAAVLVSVVALSQLGVETDLLVTIVTTVVATTGLAMGAAFALGARPVVTQILAGHFLRQEIVIGSSLEVLGKKGVVRSVGAVSTILADGDGEWVVPNEALMTEVRRR